MMGLRAMPMACLMGFRKIEYYGFDSCFSVNPKMIKEGEADYEKVRAECEGRYYSDPDTKVNYVLSEAGGVFYAYQKKRGENIQVAQTPDGKRFLTSPCFAHQVKQFTKWVDRYEGKLEIMVHGESLSAHMLKVHKDRMDKLRSDIGDKRWTSEYSVLQKELHEQGHYGMEGQVDFEMAARAIISLHCQLKRPLRILDYGCGSGALGKKIEESFTSNVAQVSYYDPFIEKYSKEPSEKFDIVACFDMLEHVEFQCVDNVLKHLAGFVKYMSVIAIHTADAVKLLADGRNAHVTQRNPQWWVNTIGLKLAIGEAIYTADHIMMACQSFDAKETMDKEIGKGSAPKKFTSD